jgi:DNA modification methylase
VRDEQTDAFEGTERLSKRLCRDCFGKREDKRPRELNDLEGKQWAAFSRSVEKFPDTRSEKQRIHGAAFPLSLAKQHIEMYSKAGDLVLDPFVGVGTTADAARELGRRCLGIDISPEFIKLARRDCGKSRGIDLICDDALNLRKHASPRSVDLLLTSPPYSNLLKTVNGAFAYKWKEHSKLASIRNPPKYSNLQHDLGNLGYAAYLDRITDFMRESAAVLREHAYSVWVVKDFRNLKQGVPYVNLHGDMIQCAQKAGFQLWDIRIFDQTQFRPLVCLGFPSRNFYLNIGHSYILVFRNE